MFSPPFMTILTFKYSYKKVKTAATIFHILQLLLLFFFHLSTPPYCLVVTSQNYILGPQSLLAGYVLLFILYIEFFLLIRICILCMWMTLLLGHISILYLWMILGLHPPWSAICSFHRLKVLPISPSLFTFLKLLFFLYISMLLSLVCHYQQGELQGRETYYTNSL